jgi:hypothetical protein
MKGLTLDERAERDDEGKNPPLLHVPRDDCEVQ